MAQIPLGNFDSVRAPTPGGNANGGAPDLGGALAAGGAKVEVGRTLMQEGAQGAAQATQLLAQRKAEDEALARAKAANALADHELKVKTVDMDIAARVASKDLPYDQAEAEHDKLVGQLPAIDIPGAGPVLQEQIRGGQANTVTAGRLGLHNVVQQAKRDDFRSQFAQNLDTQAKLAALPGADIATINARVEAYIPLGRQAGIDDAVLTKAVQEFKDRNWANQAIGVTVSHHEDPAALHTLLTALTDEKGYYADKLDPEKRNALAAQVTGQIDRLEQKAEVTANKLEAHQVRALTEMGEQDASGIPPTAEQVTAWAGLFPPGSPREPEFKQWLADGKDTQKLLTRPVAEQLSTVTTMKAALQAQGGDAHARARMARFEATVNANVKLLTEQPLAFAEQRLGMAVPDIDIASMAGSGGAAAIAGQLAERQTTITALEKSNGVRLPANLLKPQEQQLLSTLFKTMPPEQVVTVMGGLRKGLSESSYLAVMQQITPDSPVTARAGELALLQRKFTPDQQTVNGDVAVTMLRGERLLNKAKDAKGSDGKAGAYPMPEDPKLRAEFARATGDAFANNPDLAERRYQEYRAYYAGRTAEQGGGNPELDLKLAKQAAVATLGHVVSVNGHQVPAPYGMTEHEFVDQAEAHARTALAKLPPERQQLALQAAHYVQIPDPARPTASFYMLVVGRSALRVDGQVVTFRLNDHAAPIAPRAHPIASPYMADPYK